MYNDITHSDFSSNDLQQIKEKLNLVKEENKKNEDNFYNVKTNYFQLLFMCIGASTLLLIVVGVLNMLSIPFIISHIEYINNIKYLLMFDGIGGFLFTLSIFNELTDFVQYKKVRTNYLNKKDSLDRLEEDLKNKIIKLENKQENNSNVTELKPLTEKDKLENLKKELQFLKKTDEKNKEKSLKLCENGKNI